MFNESGQKNVMFAFRWVDSAWQTMEFLSVAETNWTFHAFRWGSFIHPPLMLVYWNVSVTRNDNHSNPVTVIASSSHGTNNSWSRWHWHNLHILCTILALGMTSIVSCLNYLEYLINLFCSLYPLYKATSGYPCTFSEPISPLTRSAASPSLPSPVPKTRTITVTTTKTLY